MRKNKILILFLFPLLLVGCTQISTPPSDNDGSLVVGEVYTLANGQIINNDLAVIGSSITIEEGAIINGDVSLIGSTATIAGTVHGSIFALGGSSTLTASALVSGDFNQIFHQVTIDPQATIAGNLNTYTNPGALRPAWSGLSFLFPYFSNAERIVSTRLILTAVFCFLACLIAFLLPQPTHNLMGTIQAQPAVSWGVGLLVFFAVPLIGLVFLITICLSPLALILLVVYLLAALFGWIALAALLGEKVNQWLYLHMPFIMQVLVGSLLGSLLVSLITLIPCLGLFITGIIGCYGMGGVIISRFGKILDEGSKKKTKANIQPPAPPTG
ncbi:MAG: polymer-forming cytoskeletal protein [Chloroflexi bacterium]|nr:polymer-forming cytoskeletal protein [Chloroflexota bacterium]